MHNECKVEIKEPTEEEKRRVYMALVRHSMLNCHFINKGRQTSQRAWSDDIGDSYAFSLQDFADGKYMYPLCKRKKTVEV